MHRSRIGHELHSNIVPLADAACRVSTYPADFLGLADRGRLQPGAWADVALLDRDLRVTEVFVQGGASDVAHAG